MAFQSGEDSLDGAEFNLTMVVEFDAHDSHCVLHYSPDLFEAETVDRMLEHYQIILEAVAENPGGRVSLLPILTEAEWRRVLVEWNNTWAVYPRTCVHRLLEEQVLRSPEAIALVYEDRQLTYAELNTAANRLADALSGLGVGPNVLVGICIERSVEMVVALLAILSGAYAPLEPVYPQERLAFMLADLQAPVFLCRNRAVADGLSYRGVVFLVDEWDQITADQSPENPVSAVEPDDLAYVLYTSGSTGPEWC
jgi:non-ribosomal peptide synthetase component F